MEVKNLQILSTAEQDIFFRIYHVCVLIMQFKNWIWVSQKIRRFLFHISYFLSGVCVLCVLTNKRVLRTPFAGWNQFFDAKTTFCMLLSHKMYKITQKHNKNHSISTSKRHAEHPFAGWNKQQVCVCVCARARGRLYYLQKCIMFVSF